jgi:PPOX class probable FMN-dependent enzyme
MSHRVTTTSELRGLIGEPNPLTRHKLLDALDDEAIRFIARSPFLFMGTVGPAGVPEVSPKGDEPGFVRVESPTSLVFPERPGNRLIFGLQNLIERPQIGLLFLVPATGETLRVEGTAEIVVDPALLQALSARGKPALLALRVAVTRCFFHCARAFKRSGLWEPETWPEPASVSFGRIIARELGADEKVAQEIDARTADGYKNQL